MSHSQFQLLTSRKFLPLFITQFFGAFNDNIFKSAFVVLIAFKLITSVDHAQMLINIAGGVFILPFFLFSATAGQLADKFDRTKIIHIIKFLEIIFMLIAALGFYLENIFLLMLTLFLMGTHSAFFGLIKYSALPDLVQPSELLGGNGLIEASTFIAILAGTILGTLLGVTTQGALWACGVAIVAALIGFVSSLFISKLPLADASLKINWNFIIQTGRLLGDTKKDPFVFDVILAISWFWFVGFIFITQFPVYTKSVLQGNEHIVTLFLVMFSVGIALGSLLCNRLLKGEVHLKYVPIGIWGMSLFALDFCWASHGVLAHPSAVLMALSDFLSTFSGVRITLDLLLLSVCGGFYAVPLYAAMQMKSAAAVRSQVIACNNIMGAIFMVSAALFTMGLVMVGLTTVQLFALVAVANVGVGFFVWRNRERAL
jgi:acyl-[acyl-carrier-protein]-phospholipid O-acyltransferase/long-chain-fatty-acid--[acyl-carrier-protein] ligase